MRPDVALLADLARRQGAPVRVTTQPGAFHVDPLVPCLPEGRAAAREIVSLIAAPS